MKRFKKVLLTMMSSVIAMMCVVAPISAEEIDHENDSQKNYEVVPFYWPGNPTPIPGSEAWLHEHGTKIPTGPKARNCADKVVRNKWNYLSGVLGSSLSLMGFASAFGITAAVAWAECVYG